MTSLTSRAAPFTGTAMRDMNWSLTERECISLAMVCMEHRRLEQEYEAALRVWVQQAFPQTIAIPVTSPQHAVLLREQALSARNAAASRLYLP
jgi:hypothetical protein